MFKNIFQKLGLVVVGLLLVLSAQADITLQFTTWDADQAMTVLRKVVHQFEQENPGIHVEIENIADYNLYHQKMVVRYAANDAPDVAMMDPPHFLALAKRGALLPLNHFIKNTPGVDESAWYPQSIAAHSYNGELYVLPRDIAPEGLIYFNKNIFKEAGLPYPDGTWTWSWHERPELKNKDFLWVLDQLNQFMKKRGKHHYAFIPSWPQLLLNSLAYSDGLRYVDNGQDPQKFLTNSPQWIQVGDLMANLEFKKDWIPGQTEVTSGLQSAAFQLFVNQRCAMFESGIWEVPNIRKYMNPEDKNFFPYDITLFPAFQGKPLAMPTGGSGYAIFATTKHPNAAWKLASFMAGPVGMKAMAEAGLAQPAIRKYALSSAWIPGPNTPLDQQYPPSRILTDKAVQLTVLDPTGELYPDAVTPLNAKLDNFYNGLESAKSAFTEGTAQSQQRLDYLHSLGHLPKFDWPVASGIGALVIVALVAWIYMPERKRRYTDHMRRESRSAYKFLAPWIFGMIVFTLGPMVLSLLMSTTDWDMMKAARFRGVGNYVEAATQDPRFWVSLKVTFIYTALSVPFGVILALTLALLLNQKVKGVPLFRSLYYVPSLVSTVAAALVWQKLLAPDDGVINAIIYSPIMNKVFHLGTLMSAIAQKPGQPVDWLGNPHTALLAFVLMSLWSAGGSMIILLAGLQGISDSYYEAATVDGASPWNKFKSITVPMLTPSLFFVVITGVIASFQAFTQVFTVSSSQGGPDNSTMLYMLNLYIAGFESYRFGYVAALSWVLFLIIMLVTLAQLKFNKWVYYENDLKE